MRGLRYPCFKAAVDDRLHFGGAGVRLSPGACMVVVLPLDLLATILVHDRMGRYARRCGDPLGMQRSRRWLSGHGLRQSAGARVTGMIRYEPMSLSTLADHLAATAEARRRWKLVWEFLEE